MVMEQTEHSESVAYTPWRPDEVDTLTRAVKGEIDAGLQLRAANLANELRQLQIAIIHCEPNSPERWPP